MTGRLVPVIKSARRNKQARAERAARNRALPEKAPQLIQGKAGRQFDRMFPTGPPKIPELPPPPKRKPPTTSAQRDAKRVAQLPPPPPAAVNHATTPAAAARRLTSRHLKVGGSLAAGAGVVGAGGYLVHRKMRSQRELVHELDPRR